MSKGRPIRPGQQPAAGPAAPPRGSTAAAVAPERARQPRSWLTPRRAALLLLLLAVAVYLNTLFNDFVIDDRLQIIDNEYVHQVSGLRQIFTSDVWAFAGEKAPGAYYRPLMYACWVAIWHFCGANPAGYHILNILSHGAVTLLVLLWLLRMGASRTTAWLAALLFAVHPIHTEAVAWISALPDLQCAFFFLLGFSLFLKGERTGGWRRYALLAAVAGCVLLAMLAKEIGLALPVMLVLYVLDARRHRAQGRADDSLAGRDARTMGSAACLLPYAALAVPVVVYFVIRWSVLDGANALPFVPEGMMSNMFAGWVGLLYWYVRLLVFPLTLSAFHMAPLPASFFNFQTVAGSVIAVCLAALGAWLYRRGRREWLGVALLLVTLLPSFLAPLRVEGFWIGERYLYLPSVGFCWLLAAAVDHCLRRKRTILIALVSALALLYCARTVSRNADWRQEISFYLHELRTEGESRQLRALLATNLMRDGMAEQALEQARSWVRVTPDDKRGHSMLSEIYWALEDSEHALAESRRAAELAREQGATDFAARQFANLAVLLAQSGRSDDSIAAYRDAVALDPDSADIRYSFGIAAFNAGKLEEAATQFRAAARLRPTASNYVNLGAALAGLGDFAGSRAAMGEALRLQPGDAEILARMGEVELAAGDRPAARQWLERALAADPSNPRAKSAVATLTSHSK